LGPTLQHLLVTWCKQQAKNAQSWPKAFLAMTPSVKWALVYMPFCCCGLRCFKGCQMFCTYNLHCKVSKKKKDFKLYHIGFLNTLAQNEDFLILVLQSSNKKSENSIVLISF
jgi:hypothetical protein